MNLLRKRRRGYTLIELLIVVAIIGIIAAIAIPNLLSAIDKSKQKRSVADIRNIATGVETYLVDNSHYPIATSMATISSLNPVSLGIQPNYLKVCPTRDGWGGSYRYGSDSAGTGSDYTISSYGKDGAVSASSVGVTHDFDCDIIYQTGQFMSYPDGLQK